MKRHLVRLQVLKRVAAAFAAMAATLATAQEVIPDFYKTPGLDPNRSTVNDHFSEHIDPFTGSLQLHDVDIHLPGNGGFDLDVVRSYNSASVDPLNPANGEAIAGLGWTIHFGRVLKTRSSTVCVNANSQSVADNPVLELPDGSRQILAFTGGTAPMALTTQRWRADCDGSGLSVYSPQGLRYDMTQQVNIGSSTAPVFAWYTTRITDRNGNSATINYAAAASPEISSVSTSDGRQLSFSYADSGLLTRRITGITGAAGQSFSYGYTAVPGVAGKFFLTSVTRPGGTKWLYDYNASLGTAAGSYVMKRLTYPEGGSISYTYDFVFFDSQANPASRATVVKTKVLGSGGQWSFAYTQGGTGAYDTTVVTLPDSAGTLTYKHIGANFVSSGTVWMVGLLVSKQMGDEQTETLTWDKQAISSESYLRPGAFVLKVDAGATYAPILTGRSVLRNGASYSTTYSNFDTNGNPGTVTESGPNGGERSTSLSYYTDTSKWIIRQVQNETVSGGVSVTRSFDANGNLTGLTRDGVTTRFVPDTQGNIIQATFPRSLVHTYSQYKRGIAQSETQPEGITLARVVSDAGNVTSFTNGEGKVSTYGYDGLNRLTAIGRPLGDKVSITYTATTKTATRGTLVETTAYDGFLRPQTLTLGGIARSYRHDALGRLTFVSDPGNANAGTSYQYDILDRLRSLTHQDATSQSITYGAATQSVRDERGNTTVTTYRSHGDPDAQWLMGITAPVAEASMSITRDTKDLVTAVTQAGVTRGFGYDTRGYLNSATDPETGTTTYVRDDAGNMTSRTVPGAGTTVYGYDDQNRLGSITYPGNTPAVTRTYTKTHKLKTVSSSVASLAYQYDANDNLQSAGTTIDGLSFTTGYTYNTRDQLASITYPHTGTVVDYAPDALGRPGKAGRFASRVTYYPSGQINTITYGNGAVTSYGQNSRLWPSSFDTQVVTKVATPPAAPTTRSALSMSYIYDEAGNLRNITNATDPDDERTLVYDGIHRLTGAIGSWGSGSIGYSGAGNIMSQSYGAYSLSYAYDTSNRLGSVAGSAPSSFSYDAYGDITAGLGHSYAYDGVPNLTCVDCGGNAAVQYSYDGLNQRVSVAKGGVKTYEIYDAMGQLLLEYAPASVAGKAVEHIYLGPRRIAQRVSEGGDTLLLTLQGPFGTVKDGAPADFSLWTSAPGEAVVLKDNGVVVGQGTAGYLPPCAPGMRCKAGGPPLVLEVTLHGAGTHTMTAEFAGDATYAPQLRHLAIDVAP